MTDQKSQHATATTPLLSPTTTVHSLSERINIETRPIHSQLNRLIIVRLPLALPPYTTNPSVYVSGLLHIAPIYINFEAIWQSLLEAPSTDKDHDNTTPACDYCNPSKSTNKPEYVAQIGEPLCPLGHPPRVTSRIQSLLSHLRLPGLLRAGRLRTDISSLSGASLDSTDAQLALIAHSGKLADFVAHTRESVQKNPHVLLAYAWVLYMALFSGGRYLRASLQEAGGQGTSFWTRDSSSVRPSSFRATRPYITHSESDSTLIRNARRGPAATQAEVPPSHDPRRGLQFFSFLGDEDGEDIKIDFKLRVNEASALLTSTESADIIREAQIIFEFMVDMVGELDGVMNTDADSIDQIRLASRPAAQPARNSLFLHKSRLSRHEREVTSPSERLEGSGYLEALFDGPVSTVRRIWRLNPLVNPKVSFTPVTVDMGHVPESSSASTEVEKVNGREREARSMVGMLAPFGVLLLLVVWYVFTWMCA